MTELPPPPSLTGPAIASSPLMGRQARAVEAAKLLHVNVDQLARVSTAIPVRWLGGLQPGQTVQAEANEYGADRRGRETQLGSDACRGPAETSQLLDDPLELPGRASGDVSRR